MNLIEVKDLSIGYKTSSGLLKAVEGVNFSLKAGETLGLVGESGCGKTTIGMGLMGLLPPNGSITGGSILLEGADLAQMPKEKLRELRWKEMAMIFQAAMNALNPVHRVGDQIIEAITTHEPKVGKEEALARVKALFDLVGMDRSRINDYPHQYSGGMKQRAIIAMALALRPKLIIADEPSTALDVIVQDQILKQIKKLQTDFNMGMIFISHDISIVAEISDHIGIMYAGQLVEKGRVDQVFRHPGHPYTKALLASFPRLDGEISRLMPISGEPPNLVGRIPGCRFCSRCPKPEASCSLSPPDWFEMEKGHHVLCDNCQPILN
ncbi:ABC transporter ATP-binding protein [Dethiosulfatarculus sandiegensis]|uniref:Peptide ABC transporter ATPase n=1 Tax=Dethiosulfatarculus sandiegensis TaxID=1429043 RepID=A0A0D2JUV0_9BACT|nr:ABC transporter ATP-binding protein [Dethiosulfatarculus sandiegensis]KIX13315.1 peptide ABC transporter ATPase [Dethiosulfatarculus sandiegensis]